VLTSFVAKDAQYVDEWLNDIARQSALGVFVVEVVVGCYESAAYEHMAAAVADRAESLGRLGRVSVDLFAFDPGIYGMWDALIARPSGAPIVTNWNVDDRKAPHSLLQRLNVLNSDASISAVTAGVVYHEDASFDWQSASEALANGRRRHPRATTLEDWWWKEVRLKQLFDFGEDRLLIMRDLFTYTWRRRPEELQDDDNAATALAKPFEKRSYILVTGSQNVPHNAPMWRRSLHESFGGFRPRDSRRGCYDYSFWLRALFGGAKIYHHNAPLELYYSRNTSHGHRTHVWTAKEGEEWVNECDEPDTWHRHLLALRTSVWEESSPVANYDNMSAALASSQVTQSALHRRCVLSFLFGAVAGALILHGIEAQVWTTTLWRHSHKF